MGRPTKCTPEIQARILEATELGLTRKLTADYAGIAVETLWRWMRDGKRNKGGVYQKLYQGMKRSEARGAARALSRIVKASDTSWQAAAWLLERKHGYTRNGVQEKRPAEPPKVVASLDEFLATAARDAHTLRKQATAEGSMVAAQSALKVEVELTEKLHAIRREQERDAAMTETPEQALAAVVDTLARMPDHMRERLVSLANHQAAASRLQ